MEESVIGSSRNSLQTLKLLTGNHDDDGATGEKKMEMKMGSDSGIVSREKDERRGRGSEASAILETF